MHVERKYCLSGEWRTGLDSRYEDSDKYFECKESGSADSRFC
jgi:hypothetical protein